MGTCSGAIRFFRRTSAGSMPISVANRSTARSMAAVASGQAGAPVGGDRGGVGHRRQSGKLDVRVEVFGETNWGNWPIRLIE